MTEPRLIWAKPRAVCVCIASDWNWSGVSLFDRAWMLIEGKPTLNRAYTIEEVHVDPDGTVYVGFSDFPNQWFQETGFRQVGTGWGGSANKKSSAPRPQSMMR